MGRALLIIAFCAALGFATSGVGGSLYRLVTSEPPRFVLASRSFGAAFMSFLFFAFAGPVMLVEAAWRRHRSGEGSLTLSLGGLAVALLWSLCSGMVVLEFVLAAGNGVI